MTCHHNFPYLQLSIHVDVFTQVAADLAGSSGATAAAVGSGSAAAATASGTAAAADAASGAAGGIAAAAEAAEVADAARRLRMDPQLAARAQAELRISKPQVEL